MVQTSGGTDGGGASDDYLDEAETLLCGSRENEQRPAATVKVDQVPRRPPLLPPHDGVMAGLVVAAELEAEQGDPRQPEPEPVMIPVGRDWVGSLANRWPGLRKAVEGLDRDKYWLAVGGAVLVAACASTVLVGSSWGVSWGVSWAAGGVLALRALYFWGRWAKEIAQAPSARGRRRIIGDTDYAYPALAALLLLAVFTALLLTVGDWAGAVTAGGLVGLCWVGGLGFSIFDRRTEGKWDLELVTLLAVLSWLIVLAVVPALLFTLAGVRSDSGGSSDGESSAAVAISTAGVFVFVAALWTLGWAFLWYRSPSMKPVQANQHLVGMPPYLLLRLKLLTVLAECYNYCGFSFFPALPWKAMEVPPYIPHPQAVMLAGLFQFGDVDVQHWSFLAAALTVVVSFALLGVTNAFNDRQKHLLVIQVCFDLLAAPLSAKLSSVFSCTGSDVEIVNATNLPERFCDVDTISPGAQCMDNNPSVKCWGGEHRAYICLVILLLVPYYMATLELQSAAQARQSVCKIDGGWSVVSTQSKFMLAFVASSFGSCYPIVSSVARVSATHTGRSV